ncbi:hypothetical protein Pta02_60200 [Planobispora takensis]|uniref:Uncharacterized protein n=1 Tax=Planobispora takensis TaxID=1367882 RepID=A0A8J3WYQ0_9ACTN|nr:hypothetical protein Pta02_60200 [Planobispora takensis]
MRVRSRPIPLLSTSPDTVSTATSKTTTRRWVTPAGMSSLLRSTPNIRTTYGSTTRTSTPSEAMLSPFTTRAYGRPSLRRARIRPAIGIARKAMKAA